MGLTVIPMQQKTMDLIPFLASGSEFASRILGGNPFLNPYQETMKPKNLQL
jgi:hypothetical protein